MRFLLLPVGTLHSGGTRDVSRSAVLADGYASSSGDDDGMEHLQDDSLWDDNDKWLGSKWDKAPYKYVPPALRNPPHGRIILDDSSNTGVLYPVDESKQQWYGHARSGTRYLEWYQEHYGASGSE